MCLRPELSLRCDGCYLSSGVGRCCLSCWMGIFSLMNGLSLLWGGCCLSDVVGVVSGGWVLFLWRVGVVPGGWVLCLGRVGVVSLVGSCSFSGGWLLSLRPVNVDLDKE